MENALYVGLSGQVALESKMAIVANNIANMNTPGYRSQAGLFKEVLSKEGMKTEEISLVLDYGQYETTGSGPIKETGNALDVALIGPGFLGVQTPEGVQYTRAGNFSLNEQGDLVTASGMKVADQGGGTITIPPGAKQISIDNNGVVSTDQGSVGALMIREFENIQKLKPAGNGLYAADGAATPATQTRVVQGKIEGSNVEPVSEMTKMIDVLRQYQSVQNIMQSEHERQRSAIERLSRRS